MIDSKRNDSTWEKKSEKCITFTILHCILILCIYNIWWWYLCFNKHLTGDGTSDRYFFLFCHAQVLGQCKASKSSQAMDIPPDPMLHHFGFNLLSASIALFKKMHSKNFFFFFINAQEKHAELLIKKALKLDFLRKFQIIKCFLPTNCNTTQCNEDPP